MIPDHVLRAVAEQGALNALYHATYERLPVGEVVEHWGSPFDEGVVDRLRPTRVRRKRWSHFFMVDDPKCLPALGREDPDLNLYEVTPEAPEGPLNWGWIRDIQPFRAAATRRDREHTHRYWAGVRKPDEPCLDEYLAERVRVDRHLGTLGEYLEGRSRPVDSE